MILEYLRLLGLSTEDRDRWANEMTQQVKVKSPAVLQIPSPVPGAHRC